MPRNEPLLADRRILVTGVLNDASIAFSVAPRAGGRRRGGAHLVRARDEPHATGGAAPPEAVEIVELDVSDAEHLASLAERVGGRIDGVLHAIAFAPESCLGGGFLTAPWDDVAVALQVSAYSLKALAVACRPLMTAGGSIVGLDFDASQAWPVYDWMGVAKAAFESTARYLARDLGGDGIRVNLIAAGPVRTVAAKSIPGFDQFEDVWAQRAPLGWDVKDPEPVARACVALLSDWFPATTGEVVHVDGGFHAIGA